MFGQGKKKKEKWWMEIFIVTKRYQHIVFKLEPLSGMGIYNTF